MKRHSAMILAGSIGLPILLAGSTVSVADTLDASLIGAWTTTAADCTRLFERRGGAVTYRNPVDKFAQAAIMQPSAILLPSSTCRLKSVTHVNGVVKLGAECNDSISYRSESIEIKVTPDGDIVYSPTGDPALNTTLMRCRL
jgi:hypothetical protein